MAKIKVNVFATAGQNEPVGKNFSIAVSDWTLENGEYVATIQDSRLDLNKFADIFFDETCLETACDAKITAEIEEVDPNFVIIKFTGKNLPEDIISGVYYIFEEESFMSKVRTTPCCCCNGGDGEITLNGAEVNNVSLTGADISFNGKTANVSISGGSGGLNSVSISGGAATLSGGDLTIEIASQTDENFTTAEKNKLAGIDTTQFVTIESGKGLSTEDFTTAEKVKLNSVEANAQENVIEKIYFNGAELQIDSKAVSIESSGAARQNPALSISPSEVTLSAATPEQIITLTTASDAIATYYGNNDSIASVTKLTDTTAKISHSVLDGETLIVVQKPENATYYGSEKTVRVVSNFDVANLTFENSRINDAAGILTWQNTDCTFANDCLILNGTTPCITADLGNIDLSEGDFAFEMLVKITNLNLYSPLIAICHSHDNCNGIFMSTDTVTQNLWWNFATADGTWASNKRVGQYLDASWNKIKYFRQGNYFAGYLNDTLVYEDSNASAIYKANNLLGLGYGTINKDLQIKSFRLRKGTHLI